MYKPYSPTNQKPHLVKPVLGIIFLVGLLFAGGSVFANIPGGGNGTGAAVTITTNTSANTITMSNGIVTAVISIYSSQILQLTYNGNQVTDGGTGGNNAINWQGQNAVGVQEGANGVLSYVTNNGNFAEICIANLYANQGTTNAYAADAYYYFSMFRGSPGIYVTEDMERTKNAPAGGADIPSLTSQLWGNFNWLGQDNGRFLLRETPADSGAAIPGINNAPKEVTLLNQGLLAGQFECKYDFAGDLNALHFAGWASTGLSTNIGLWLIHPSREYFSGGPKHPEIVGQIDMINCTFKSVHFGFGSDLNFTNGETWSRVCGPLFFYFNQVPPGTANPQIPLYTDVADQAAAEAGAWPYTWFTANTNYAQASSRGTVSGKLVIADNGNPNASAAGMWVGVEEQPPSSLNPPTTDFQFFGKNLQFWVKTDMNGNFTIPNVYAGTNYTLLAFGPGAIGLYQSQSFGSPAPPVQLYIPPTPFAVTVIGGQTDNLGTVTWTPVRVGATVWEMGVPDRDTTEFRHGADYWHGDLGNATNFPVNWAQWQDYNLDFPTGVNFTVGQSRWSADWDYAQPTSLDPTTGNLNGTTQNIFFNLPSAPAGNSQASIYFAISGDYSGPVEVTVNGTLLNGTGFFPYYSSDPMIRMESHGIFCDYRLNFAGNLLNQGQNEIQLNMRKGGYFSDGILYDYIRLELTGYVPPTPAGLTAIAGNGVVVLDWPASSGATSYNVLRSTTSGSGYSTIATNVIGPVVGSDVPDATYTDNSVANDTPYYYVVSAVNPNGQSTNSVDAGATPSASTPAAPAAPAGLTVTPGNLQATFNWNASPGAATYTIQRTVITGGAHTNDPGAEVATQPDGSAPIVTVNSFVTTTNYTDTGLANNVQYSYTVSAANANGQSAASAPVSATTSPAFPVTPAGLSATVISNEVNLSWNPAANAASYVLQRATSISGPYTAVYYPGWLSGFTDGPLSYNTTYYYEVASANLAGVSTNSAPLTVTIVPAPPVLTAVASNALVSLNWNASPGATNYVLQSSTTSGGPYNTIVSTTNTGYSNTNLFNGTTYYYVVYAVGPNGQSPLSTEVSATPASGAGLFTWINTVTTSPQSWNDNGNWSSGTSFPDGIQSVATVNSAISANQTIDLNQATTIGTLNIGASGGVAAFNVTGNGGTLALNNAPNPALLMQLSTSRGDTISAPMTVNGSLLVTNASANAFTVSGNISGATNGITVYGNVNVSGNISVDTNGITAYGPVNLSGTNTYTGNTAVFAGNLTVSGGTINAPNSTITVGNGATGVSFDVTGGTVTANALNVAPVGGSTGDNASITGSGSAVFTNVNLGSGGNTSGPFTINTTGSVALGALIDYKDLSGNGPSTTSGLIIDNGSVTASSVIIQDTGSGANMNINGGSLTIGNSASTGAFEIGNGGSTRGGWLIMSGGSLTYLGTDGLLMLLNSGSEGSANISGATSIATLTGLTLNKINVAGASSWLTLSGGATLYLGKVGLVINQPSATAYASLGTATVGAITNWSSTAPITLTGTVIFQAADASGVAHNISLGGPLSGAGGLIKTGAGMLTLSGTNTYSGGITVSNGTLLANSMAGSATGPGSVTVAGGTLGGIGIISGAVTVNSGGMLAPGNPLGVLTVSNTLTLAAGSTTFMQVQHSPLTNNNTKVSSTLTEGGTLNVTNISATPLSNGDNFKLFNAGSYSGAFAAYVLPPLGPNLAWKTSTLNSNGVISVVPLTSPSIIGASIDVNGNLVCSGTGAPADWSYRVLTSTNVTLPLAQWTSIATNQTDAGGNFFATNRVGTNVLQSFLILQFQ